MSADGWTPISSGVPAMGVAVLVSVLRKDPDRTVVRVSKRMMGWSVYDDSGREVEELDGRVLAWRPLPKAYVETTQEQPAPRPNKLKPIWDLVIEDMKERDRAWRALSGNPLKAFNGRYALWDAYGQALDVVVYLRQALVQREG